MSFFWIAFILGIVEGLTEFLPVSSTGHLIVVGRLLGFDGPRAATFEVIIQFGAILAVVVVERRVFFGLLAGGRRSGFSGLRGCTLLAITTVPMLILGALLHGWIKTMLFHPLPVALALLTGGIGILVVERFRTENRIDSIDGIGYREAVWIGLAQCLAMWPGMSRAAATILGGRLLGLERRTAAVYSFLAAVPVLTAATAYDLLRSFDQFQPGDWVGLGTGLIVSFLAAWAAVRSFVALLGRFTLRPFAWYRIAIAPVIYLLFR
ncbi:MAG TPA: undecaprenyl-diphosphate phosphatase [Candidatus Polarisedimenticolia bacterium]|nr:undecaprenyl-diphosphate phosphatase [Candidatus Polarisedimenticolia bacterium]